MTVRVGIVVLNWNGGAQTLACIESLRQQKWSEQFIVLVDNGSAATERDALARRYDGAKDVHCRFLDENLGYAGGNNVGIKDALSRGAEVIVIATQDVVFRPGALAQLVAAAAHPAVGIAAPKVVCSDGERVLSRGERLIVPLLCIPRSWLRYRRERRAPYDVSGVIGCALLLTPRCIEAVGGFDEGFFAYYEEVDLCLRVRRAGFRVVLAPGAEVVHDGMRGFASGFTTVSAELKARNLIRLMRRWARPLDYLVLVPSYALLVGASAVLYALRGRGDIVAAMRRGVVAGLQGRQGKPMVDLS